jgi:hypothetical protein
MREEDEDKNVDKHQRGSRRWRQQRSPSMPEQTGERPPTPVPSGYLDKQHTTYD